jgi:hypothetical protein
MGVAVLAHTSGQSRGNFSLPAQRRSDKHKAVAHQRRLVQLNALKHPRRCQDQLVALDDLGVSSFNVLVDFFRGVGHLRKEILQEGEEERDLGGILFCFVSSGGRGTEEAWGNVILFDCI